jgi:hypothetical protein
MLMKVFYCSLQLCLSSSFLFDLLLHELSTLGHCLSSGHLLVYESEALIFLVGTCYFIHDDYFDLVFQVLLLIFLSFGFLAVG